MCADKLRTRSVNAHFFLGTWILTAFVCPERRNNPDKPSPSEIAKCIESEGAAIAAKIPQNAVIAAMCIEGEMLSSESFSQKLENLMSDESASELCFVIGGSYGLSDEIKKRAKLRLSLSRMTFTHQISRVLILEQIYRAFQISTGGKYHK